MRRFLRKMPYLFCFALLNLVDFIFHTYNGDVKDVVVNFPILILLVIIAMEYPLRAFQSIFTLLCTLAGAVVLAIIFFMHQSSYFGMYAPGFALMVISIWGLCCLAKVILLPWIKDGANLKNLSPAAWIWIAMTACMTLSRCGTLWQVLYLAAFAMFFLTKYTAEKRQRLVEGMIDGTILFFFCLQIYAYGFRPYDEVRYKGAFTNCNINALHYLMVYLMILFKLHILHLRKAKIGWKLFYFLGAGGMLCFLVMTMGRTAWMVAIIITSCYGVFVMKTIWKEKWSGILLRGAALCLTFLLMFPAVFGTVRWLPTILHHPVWCGGEYGEWRVHSWDPADSEKYVELDEFLGVFFHRIGGTLRTSYNQEEKVRIVPVRTEPEAYLTTEDNSENEVPLEGWDGMDESLRFRLTIAKNFLADLRLLGHHSTDGHFHVKGTDYTIWHAQNVWLQMAYYYGIPAGILFIILTYFMLRAGIILFRRGENKEFCIIPIFLMMAFFLYGTMELVWLNGQLILFLVFFAQWPEMAKNG